MPNKISLKLIDAEAFVLQCRLYEEYPFYVGKADDILGPEGRLATYTYGAISLHQGELASFKEVYSKFKNLAVGPFKSVGSTYIDIIQVSVTDDELRILKDVVANLRIRAVGNFKLQGVDKIYLDIVQSCFAKLWGFAKPSVESYVSPFTGKIE